MNTDQSILSSTTMNQSLHNNNNNNLYSSPTTNTSDFNTMMTMMMMMRSKRKYSTIPMTTINPTEDNLSMTIEHRPIIMNHDQISSNTLSIHQITENQLNFCKKEHYREHQRRKRASLQYRHAHAARERQRVAEFNKTFKKLHSLLPTNDSTGRRLSKLQILKLCSSYIYYLTCLLQNNNCNCSMLK
ncbi:unnamed protein product [Schistosoma turkestanicum]|nr:unnamed protein product [Schistosoma turkestanicum]